ncbi:Hsp20/alpha crystallin family protein [Salinisphaera sp. SPP-AMP-43]|uniref:Hsp20/alpha crystallin family protein n=1 Tax=Salinisphaera sp. SPP-AMP-43 TaxID=3121288 RepID=UPI003C6E20CF
MAIQRYQPSSLLQQFNDEISRMFLGQTDALPSGMGDQWRPAIDIHENDEAYLIDAEVPGVDPAAIEITLRNGVLTVAGERSYHYDSSKAKENGGALVSEEMTREPTRHIERRYGRFVRRFTLPDTADEDAVEARADKGVLHIKVPKKTQTQPRRIEIKAE